MPVLHARTRQELCEYCPYFKSYQSGVYWQDGVCTGILLDKYATIGDAWENGGLTFVTHGGGKSRPINCGGSNRPSVLVLDGAEASAEIYTPKYELRESQLVTDNCIAAMLAAKVAGSPVAAILGSQYPLATNIALPGRYNVLGWYQIREMWATKEYSSNMSEWSIRFKFLFQWITHRTQDPWFLRSRTEIAFGTSAGISLTHSCPDCSECSPIVYNIAVCLNQRCLRFFQFYDEVRGGAIDINTSLPPKDLYSCEFLARRETISEITDCLPSIFEQISPFSFAHHCVSCGRISNRIYMTQWKCLNNICDAKDSVQYRLSSLSPTPNPYVQFPSVIDAAYINPSSGISCQLILRSNFAKEFSIFYNRPAVVYTLPDGAGKIHHFKNVTGHLGVRRLSEADELWKSFVESDCFPLRRQTLRHHLIANFLSQQFSCNVGRAYRYAADHAESPISAAPLSLQSAIRHICSAVQTTELNEFLVLGYLPGQKMNYHSDDEKNVGDTICSWSFGVSAEMRFKRKMIPTQLIANCDENQYLSRGDEYSFGTVNKPQFVYPPLSMIMNAPSDKEIVFRFIQRQKTPIVNSKVQKKEIAATKKKESRKRKVEWKGNRVCLKLQLGHGDLLIMDGKRIQSEYAHCIQPMKGVRFVVTARHIK